MIDWTKPIRIKGDHRRVHVIAAPYQPTPDDEPCVLISILPDTKRTSDPTPLRRNLDGSPHPAEGRRAVACVLENVPEHRTFHYWVEPNAQGGVGFVQMSSPGKNTITLTFDEEGNLV